MDTTTGDASSQPETTSEDDDDDDDEEEGGGGGGGGSCYHSCRRSNGTTTTEPRAALPGQCCCDNHHHHHLHRHRRITDEVISRRRHPVGVGATTMLDVATGAGLPPACTYGRTTASGASSCRGGQGHCHTRVMGMATCLGDGHIMTSCSATTTTTTTTTTAATTAAAVTADDTSRHTGKTHHTNTIHQDGRTEADLGDAGCTRDGDAGCTRDGEALDCRGRPARAEELKCHCNCPTKGHGEWSHADDGGGSLPNGGSPSNLLRSGGMSLAAKEAL